MARRRPGPGRPSKGERKGYFTRVPIEDALQVDAAADAADVSYSEYIAALIALGLRYRDELPEKFQPKPAEEVLPEAS